MKTRVIPAQVTTVEDKIAGNLNFTQIILLIASVLVNTAVFAIMPSPMKFNLYKLPLILFIFMIFGALAVRIKGRVIINWVALLAVYFLRPHIYVFDKNSDFLRETASELKIKKGPKIYKPEEEKKDKKNTDYSAVDITEIVRSQNLNIKLGKKAIYGIFK